MSVILFCLFGSTQTLASQLDRSTPLVSTPYLLTPCNTMTAQRPNNTPRESQRISPTLIQPNKESIISSPSLPSLKIGRYNNNSRMWNLSCLHPSLKSQPAHQHSLNHSQWAHCSTSCPLFRETNVVSFFSYCRGRLPFTLSLKELLRTSFMITLLFEKKKQEL